MKIRQEIDNRLNFGNAYYHSIFNILYFHLLYKNIKNKFYKAVILRAVL
jgi:hypothetical protein